MKKILLILIMFVVFSSYGQLIQRVVKATSYLATDTIKTLSGHGLNVYGNQIKWLGDPTLPQDGVNYRTLDYYFLRADTATKLVTYTMLADALSPISDLINDSVLHIQRTETATGLKSFSNIDNLIFNQSVSPSFSVGQLAWDSDNNTLSLGVVDGAIQLGQEHFDYYTNLEGSPITNGTIVSIVSATGNRTAVNKTDATDASRSKNCIGMVTIPSISNNNTGRITKRGKVRGLNTSHLTEGAIVYVDPAKKGRMTDTIPTAPNYVIRVGVCDVTSTNNGVIDLDIDVSPTMQSLSDVNGTPLTKSGQIPVWNNTGKYFDFTDNVTDSVVHIQRTQTITGAKTFTNTVTINNPTGSGIGSTIEADYIGLESDGLGATTGYGISGRAYNVPVQATNLTTGTLSGYYKNYVLRMNSANATTNTNFSTGIDWLLPIDGWVDPVLSEKVAIRISGRWSDVTVGAEKANLDFFLTSGASSVKIKTLSSNGDEETLRGSYHYYSQTMGVDTAGDWRTYADANGFHTEYCTVGNATKGAGTWVMKQLIQP